MLIRCTFSVPLERIRDYARGLPELSSLPAYITKRGPYIKDAAGAGTKIMRRWGQIFILDNALDVV